MMLTDFIDKLTDILAVEGDIPVVLSTDKRVRLPVVARDYKDASKDYVVIE